MRGNAPVVPPEVVILGSNEKEKRKRSQMPGTTGSKRGKSNRKQCLLLVLIGLSARRRCQLPQFRNQIRYRVHYVVDFIFSVLDADREPQGGPSL